MSLFAKAAAALKRFDRKTWPRHRVVITSALVRILGSHKLVIADVGAAAGPEDLWEPVRTLTLFVTFDPVNRGGDAPGRWDMTNFQVGLSDEPGRGLLHVLRIGDASTLYQVNREFIEDFAIHEGLDLLETVPVDLTTLDLCLRERPDLAPDFLKVDVEGADLDVLRGAAEHLKSSIFGVRVEVSFAERHLQAPFFGDIDSYLRGHGFVLFHLSQESWIRRNGVYGASSRPQVIWGDGVYFLRRTAFLERVSALAPDQRERQLVKAVLLLATHGIHDYAWELVEAAARGGLVSSALEQDLKQAVRRSLDGSAMYLTKNFAGLLFSLGLFLAAWPVPSARLQARFYLKQRAARFFSAMLQAAARGGPRDSCISG